MGWLVASRLASSYATLAVEHAGRNRRDSALHGQAPEE